jgi:hypothetical protein
VSAPSAVFLEHQNKKKRERNMPGIRITVKCGSMYVYTETQFAGDQKSIL